MTKGSHIIRALLFLLPILPLLYAEVDHTIIEEDITHYWVAFRDKYESDSTTLLENSCLSFDVRDLGYFELFGESDKPVVEMIESFENKTFRNQSSWITSLHVGKMIVFKHSTDEGQSWKIAAQIEGEAGSYISQYNIHFFPNNILVCLWKSNLGNEKTLNCSVSEDLGKSWHHEKLCTFQERSFFPLDRLSYQYLPKELPAIFYEDGKILLSWKFDSLFHYRCSRDFGRSWTSTQIAPQNEKSKWGIRSFHKLDEEERLLLLDVDENPISYWISENFGDDWGTESCLDFGKDTDLYLEYEKLSEKGDFYVIFSDWDDPEELILAYLTKNAHQLEVLDSFEIDNDDVFPFITAEGQLEITKVGPGHKELSFMHKPSDQYEKSILNESDLNAELYDVIPLSDEKILILWDESFNEVEDCKLCLSVVSKDRSKIFTHKFYTDVLFDDIKCVHNENTIVVTCNYMGNRLFFASEDGGENWTHSRMEVDLSFFLSKSVALSPNGMLLASIHEITSTDNELFFTSREFISNDLGKTWNRAMEEKL
ncbi:MAG: hypothetical protein K1000chlam3_01601 [Chlamydiae bacterium]|nr:hypothetical protein [Chlamydiota bacterium]